MLPSSGYFQSIVCPFFKNGLCERAHCHFKHVKPGNNEKSQWSSGDDVIFAGIQPNSDAANTFNRRPGTHSYIPTPVERTVTKTGGILKAPPIKTEKGASIPEYRPTPITRLNYNGSDVKPLVITLDNSPPPPAIRKRKKVDEYDPEEVRYSRKRVSFNLPDEEEAQSDNVITLSSDEDEPTAKFSDDDLTDDDLNHSKSKVKNTTETRVVIKTEIKEEKQEVSEFSLVDKILDDVVKNEEFIRGFKKPIKTEITNASEVKPSSSKSEEDVTESTFKNVIDIDGKSLKASPDKVVVKEEDVEKAIDTKTQPEKPDGRTQEINNSTEQNTEGVEKQKEKSKTSRDESKEHKKEKSSKEEKTKALQRERDKTSKKEKVKDDKKPSASSNKSKSSDEKSKHAKDGTLKENPKKKTIEGHKSSKSDKISKDSHKHSHSKSSKHVSSKPDAHKSTKSDDKSKHSKKPAETKDKIDKNKLGHEKSKSSKDAAHSKTKHGDKTSHKKTESSAKVNSTSKIHTKSSTSSSKTDRKDSGKTDKKDSSKIDKKDSSKTDKEKASKKIQDEKISSSSVVKSKDDSIFDNKEIVGSDDIAADDYVDSDLDDVYHNGSGSDMDSDTLEECYRIFNEDKSTAPITDHDQASFQKPVIKEDDPIEQSVSSGKKRRAHQADLTRNVQSPLRKKERLNPAQVMHDRYLKLQEQYSRMNEGKDENVRKKSSSPLGAHIAANVKKLLAANGSSSGASAESYTPVTTVKGEKRVAHVPIVAMSARPIIPSAYGSKVASCIRQKYLNSFIDECLKFCHTEEQAFETSLEEEKNAYNRSTNKTIYLNIAANALNRLRRKAREGPSSEASSEPSAPSKVSSTTPVPSSNLSRTISHEMMLAGPRAQKFSYSIERKKPQKAPEVVLRGEVLYSMLSEYLLTEEQLAENGFPLPHESEPGRVVITGIYANKTPACNDPFRRTCNRCSKTYFVDEDGDYTKEEECDYHWGRIYKRRIAGSIEARYMCCQGDNESDGCCVSAGHVFDGSDEHRLNGYVKTLQKTPIGKNYGVYALDCEMCYTTAGMELTRVTVIGPDMDPVFNSFVQPENRVLDYNTRFSGITADDLVGQSKSLRDVQAVLLGLFNSKTILIGHSLESDFKALKLIHKSVVDTSVVFPHKLGLPFKRALRTLMAEHCHKIIQNNIGGHDSQEDAAACMELMLMKLKEDLRTAGRV